LEAVKLEAVWGVPEQKRFMVFELFVDCISTSEFGIVVAGVVDFLFLISSNWELWEDCTLELETGRTSILEPDDIDSEIWK
jgi:hypothetical protein